MRVGVFFLFFLGGGGWERGRGAFMHYDFLPYVLVQEKYDWRRQIRSWRRLLLLTAGNAGTAVSLFPPVPAVCCDKQTLWPSFNQQVEHRQSRSFRFFFKNGRRNTFCSCSFGGMNGGLRLAAGRSVARVSSGLMSRLKVSFKDLPD